MFAPPLKYYLSQPIIFFPLTNYVIIYSLHKDILFIYQIHNNIIL